MTKGRARLAPIAALALGVAYMTAVHWAGHDRIYRFAADSASYLEMARSLREQGRPLVVPWAPVPSATDAIPQALFPPGYPLMIAAAMTVLPDARSAALWINTLSAALLPLLILWGFRSEFSDRVLLLTGALTLSTAGVQMWSYIGYSDVPALALSIAALGACIRGQPGKAAPLFLAGLLSGACYATRNSTLAVAATCGGWLMLRALEDRRWRTGLAAWVAGAALPITALEFYELRLFGQWQPYDLDRSTRLPVANIADWVTGLLQDLRLPTTLLEAPHQPEIPCITIALSALVGLLLLSRQSGGQPRRRVELLGLFVVASAAVHVAARSRYEWADTINMRHTLQATWAMILLCCDGASRWRAPRAAQARGVLAAVALALLAGGAAREAALVKRGPPEDWYRLASEPAAVAAVEALPRNTFILSNLAFLFRIEAARPVRQYDSYGDSLQDVLRQASRFVPRGRTGAYLLVCDSGLTSLPTCRSAAQAAPAACRIVRSELPRAWLCSLDSPAT